jgi:hypothetical protein
MSEPQAVAVKFEGEELATATDEVSTNPATARAMASTGST